MAKSNNVIRMRDADPALIKRLEAKYGPVNMEEDFLDRELKTYFKANAPEDRGEGGGITHDIIKLSNFGEVLTKLSAALKAAKALKKTDDGKQDPFIADIEQMTKDVFNKYRTHLRKNYEDQYNAVKQLLDEMSTTGGSATFTPGTGAQYATPYAFSGKKKGKYQDGGVYTKKFGYKLVPNKIKGSGVETKQLFEAQSTEEYQQERINAFDRIEQELNDIYKMLSNAKNETSEYYNENPGSYAVVKPTDLVLDYIQDIKNLLRGE